MVNEAKQAWDSIAEGYNQYVTDSEVWLANEALARVNINPGLYFLDVAAGCGGLSLPAARLGANVLATDWSPEMIRLLNDRVKEENLLNVECKVMDGHDLDIEDNIFDISGSQFGVMLFPDLPKALKEMTRVTKPGGKVLIIAYGNPNKIDFLQIFISALRDVVPDFNGMPDNPPPLEFQVADPSVLYQRLMEAGLKNIQVDTVTEKLEFSSGIDFWNWVINGNPIVGHIISMLGLNDSKIKMVQQRLDQMIKQRSGNNNSAIINNQVNIGYGVK